MIVNNVELFRTAVNKSGYPSDSPPLPEIAFVGKSNVGKSSLINTLVSRKALARTSKQPGKTRAINFYIVENMLYFVDLPGYGYAKVSKSEKEKWGGMIEGYLKNRDELKAALLLVDIRHEPSENDKMMLDWFKYYDKKVIIAATKSDKLKRSQLQKHIKAICDALGVANEDVVPFSSETKAGREEIWEKIELAIKEN